MRSRSIPVWPVALVALLAIAWYLVGGSVGGLVGGSVDAGSSDPTNTAIGMEAEAATGSRFSDLDVVAVGDLPAEAHETIDLILAGGPYPYSRDDSTFQNRERLLPIRADGHYREYTVVTPGEDDRGARRIVTGADGEFYYTDDHYSSFREISDVER